MKQLTVHQIDHAEDADHEEEAHRDDEDGDLSALAAHGVGLGPGTGAAKSVDDREVRGRGDRELVEVFGFGPGGVLAGHVEH